MTTEQEAEKTLQPYKFAIRFTQEVDGIVLAESEKLALEDINEKGTQLPDFKVTSIAAISKDEYKRLVRENIAGYADVTYSDINEEKKEVVH